LDAELVTTGRCWVRIGGAAVKLLILTGLRCGEIGELCWSVEFF
jgi:hypothetical protein